MFQGIHPAAQIIIAIAILIVLIILALIVWKRGIKFGYKKGRIDINGQPTGCIDDEMFTLKAKDFEALIEVIMDSMSEVVRLNRNDTLERKMDYVEVKLSDFQGVKETRFYKLLKDQGVPQDDLTSHPDATFYLQVLNGAIYKDNGEMGIKSMIRKVLRHKSYDKSDLPPEQQREAEQLFILEFTKQINQKIRKYMVYNYKSRVSDYEGREKRRLVSNEELYESDTDPEHLSQLQDLLTSIIIQAKIIDEQTSREHERLLKERKKRIAQVLYVKEGTL